MRIAESLLPEFDEEMAGTRKTLEMLPDDKLDWKAHPKSNTIGWVAGHLAELADWAEGTLTRPSWDVSPVGGEPYQSPKATSRRQIRELFDKNVAAAREALSATTDEAFGEDWSLLVAGQPIFTMPRLTVFRRFVLNHMIHHRAHLCVYLRMNDIPVPGLYGPSADDAG